ncbi:hypothetical protein DFH09DRAFT_1314040 [Mycena vulgaris]|nr:hypothetical protein DFH09DRAFT_1314040 [Mycena vulgaris]
MSLLIEGRPSCVDYPAPLSKILVTTVVPNQSTVLSCLSSASLGVDVVLGPD